MTEVTEEGFSFDIIEEHVRKKTYGVFTAIDSKSRPHSTGILYGVSPPGSRFVFYILTSDRYAKVRHIRRNPNVSLVVSFPHYYLRFVPANYAMFRGLADVVPFEDEDAQWAFKQKRILRMNLETDPGSHKLLFIRMSPEPTVFCYGVGFGILQLRSSHETAMYKVTIPEHRL